MDPNTQNSNNQQPPLAGPTQTPPPTPVSPPNPSPAPVQQPWQPESNTPQSVTPPLDPNPTPPNNKKPLIIAAVVVIVLALAVGAYFLFFAKDKSITEVSNESQKSAESSAIDIATLPGLTFNHPANLGEYTKSDFGSTTTFTSYTNASNTCEIGLGTISAEILPGATSQEVIEKQVEGLREAGATVENPTAGEALVLKDANDSSKTYKIPTLVFKFSQGNNHGLNYYSIAILGNGDRAIINRTCINQDGQAVAESTLDPLEVMAKEITVTPAQ